MAGRIERKEVIYMLILVSFIFGVFYFYKGQYFLNDFMGASGQSRSTGMVVQRTQADQKFKKAIEASLNSLLEDVLIEMQEYRKRRKILDELVQPKNLRDPKYIIETYQIALRTIPDLRQRSDNIIKVFSAKDAELKRMIQGRSPSAQKNILQSWSTVKAQQVDLYVNYFTIEQTILQRYEQLIGLYYKNRNDVVYYPEGNSVAFNTQPLNAQASAFNQDIKRLKKQQADITK